MKRRRSMTVIALLSVLAAVPACGGGGGGDAGSPAPTAGESRSAGRPGGTASPAPDATGGSTAPAPSASRSSAPPSEGGEGAADDAPRSASRKSGKGRGADETELAVLTGVRVGAHGAYDRVVFDFRGGAPAYVAEYVAALHQDGSGEEIPVEGEHRLMLVFSRARPEDPQKEFDTGDTTTPTVRDLAFVSYFEGDVRFGIGVDARRGDGRPGFRVTAVENRIVVDIAHAAAG
ncbi:hypothetical protein GCM10010420_07170 [Streptomyces glaucosporus]|uniref:AMIN-like domain-containing protein n=1 Tax=Streptomyces glaucosporus TaxID=284044 RepID=A0ABP5UVI4_9ACTN